MGVGGRSITSGSPWLIGGTFEEGKEPRGIRRLGPRGSSEGHCMGLSKKESESRKMELKESKRYGGLIGKVLKEKQ